jgi:DNA gyrase subunit A
MRGGKGILTYKITEKTGNLIGATIVDEEDDIILINKEGTIIRISVNEISSMGRVTSGVTLMRVDDEDSKVVSLAKVNISESSSEEDPSTEDVNEEKAEEKSEEAEK